MDNKETKKGHYSLHCRMGEQDITNRCVHWSACKCMIVFGREAREALCTCCMCVCVCTCVSVFAFLFYMCVLFRICKLKHELLDTTCQKEEPAPDFKRTDQNNNKTPGI